MSSRLGPYLKEYAGFHAARGNKICHYIGIPMIMVSLLGLLSHLPVLASPFYPALFQLDGALIFLALAFIWYFRLDWKVALGFGFVSLGLYFLSRSLPVGALASLFVVGWIFQLVGHAHYEGNSPAFTKNLEHLLIGPLWIYCHAIGYPTPNNNH